jgi:predicted SprT family Zn-dependent metalloprotease
MNRLDMVRDALQTLGDAPAHELTVYVAAKYGVRIEPKFIPVFRASLLDRERMEARRAAQAAAIQSLVVPTVEPIPLPDFGQPRFDAVQTFASRLMVVHGLHDWSFAYNRRKRSMGLCVYQRRTIELSTPFVERNGPSEILDTILHEIAHALVGPNHGHDAVWKRKCLEVGAKPQRCGEAEMPEGRWKAQCGGCGKEYQRYRKPKRMRGWFCRGCGQERGGLVWKEE